MMINYINKGASMRAKHFVCVLATVESMAKIWPVKYSIFNPPVTSAAVHS